MLARASGSPAKNPPLMGRLLACLCLLVLVSAAPARAAEIHSVYVDREQEKIVVEGAGFANPLSASLAGGVVPATRVSASLVEIPFGAEIYSTVQWQGSYRLEVDGVTLFVYFAAPVIEPPPPPPPEPPPPTGGPACPCIAGWEASAIPKDNFTWCLYGQDGTQLWFNGNREGRWTIGMAFDPYQPYFDPVEPGNSISYCVLIDNGSYNVAEPVTNIDQYSDCENYMWQNICL